VPRRRTTMPASSAAASRTSSRASEP
jgi:hypothetical protein